MSASVISVAQMRHWEQASWDAGISQSEVIRRAGEAVAHCALKLTRAGDRVLILAGKGHNGDDARCAQSHLIDRNVELLNVNDPAKALAEFEAAARRKPALVIDGLFGIGLNRPLDDRWAELIEAINRANLSVLAVDVPSGLNSDTGEPQNVALYAHTTVTFGAPKAGMLLASSYPFVGRLEVVPEIGLTPCPFTGELIWTAAADFEGFPPFRRVDGHKGSFGHVAVLAGSKGYHGAAVLGARGALRARPGLVSVFCDEAVYQPVAGQLQAPMVHPFRPGLTLPETCTALVIGPGLAAQALDASWKDFANEQWQHCPLPVIVDASALQWIKPGATALNSRRVITPHPGEAARLLGSKSNLVQENRIGTLREISSRYGNCWVVLKGHQTLIGRSSGEIFVNSTGNPFLAQGGSGDVLAGFLGGLLAQPKLQAQPLKTIRYAVWAHGLAADQLAEQVRTWTIEELLQVIGDAKDPVR
ncbi:MAG TPA: NAD(P)H-hydrate dehydratase [Verrucomicrobiae bacterium]|jgi:NAD(P)H-hydrate epimerase|nr:NAD(P)H-hydrate dehydratase [Verrucomicrobiae bacterium]